MGNKQLRRDEISNGHFSDLKQYLGTNPSIHKGCQKFTESIES